MYTFIEICKARDSWLKLSAEDREAFLAPVEAAMNALEKAGAQIISWGYNEPSTPARADYDYFAVFLFPNKSLAMEYEILFSRSGWYTYFEQVNVSGNSENFTATIKKLADV